jgi:hypothetical protein
MKERLRNRETERQGEEEAERNEYTQIREKSSRFLSKKLIEKID